jgi:hypothetical protein
MTRKRRVFGPTLKAKVALAAMCVAQSLVLYDAGIEPPRTEFPGVKWAEKKAGRGRDG